jgi:putative flippase GtrA
MKVTTKVIRYGLVGVIAFVIDYGITKWLVAFLPLLVANTIGFIVANSVNFCMAHRWVFGYAWTKEKLLSTYLAVLGVSVVGLIVNNIVVWLSVGIAGASLLFGKVLATAIVMLWNFLARLFWVYKTKSS